MKSSGVIVSKIRTCNNYIVFRHYWFVTGSCRNNSHLIYHQLDDHHNTLQSLDDLTENMKRSLPANIHSHLQHPCLINPRIIQKALPDGVNLKNHLLEPQLIGLMCHDKQMLVMNFLT